METVTQEHLGVGRDMQVRLELEYMDIRGQQSIRGIHGRPKSHTNRDPNSANLFGFMKVAQIV